MSQYKQERDEALKRLRTNFDQYSATVEEKLRRRAADDLRDNIAKLEAKLKSYGQQKEILDNEIAARQTELGKLKLAAQANERSTHGVASLLDDVAQTEMVLKRLGEELGSIQIDNSTGARVEVMDKKTVPTGRKADTQMKYAGVVGLVLFGAVFFGVVFWEYGHRRVYSANDVTRGLNLPVLGTLPKLSAAARQGVPAASAAQHTREQNAMIESIDAIRTSLLHAARTDDIRVVMVTSPNFGEGKTTLACHLAASLARGSRNTLLIDCDLRNPAAHRQFDLPNEPGLSEALRAELEFEEAILPTPIARLSLLPAGKADRQAIQCLAQEIVEKTIRLLREQYDFIVIDVSPVLPVADSLLIGQYADAVIFSVLQNVSRLPALHAAQQKLSALGVRLLGAVVIGEKAETYDYPQSLRP
jgi:capsular exopolysaccharide synthesis family protein